MTGVTVRNMAVRRFGKWLLIGLITLAGVLAIAVTLTIWMASAYWAEKADVNQSHF